MTISGLPYLHRALALHSPSEGTTEMHRYDGHEST